MIRRAAPAFFLCIAFFVSFGGIINAQSLEQLKANATAGNIDAQVQLAEKYRTGNGVLQNHAAAGAWYQKAANQGDARALHRLGLQLMSGLGVEPNPDQGLAMLEAAAKSGDPDIVFDLASAYQSGAAGQPDMARAADLYEVAAGASDEAAVSLATLYLEGKGRETDIAKAVELYTGPADRGHVRALNNLGLVYVRGLLGDVDYSKAVQYFAASSERGFPVAMRNLAAMYENGFGVETNEELAKDLLRRAALGGDEAVINYATDLRLVAMTAENVADFVEGAALGDPISNLYLGMALLQRSQGEDMNDLRQAGRAFAIAAERGIPAAMANLGIMKFNGRGVLQDFTDGYAWLTVAGSLGQSDAIATRDALATSMTIAQINAAQLLAEQLWVKLTGRAP